MMRPKILFTDIDGTLLNKQRMLSADNIDQIRSLYQELKVPVILVSARMPSSMRLLQAELGIDTHMVCYNGALVLGHNSNEIVKDERINEKLCREIIALGESQDMHIAIFVYHDWYASRSDKWSDKEILVTRVQPTAYDIRESYSPDRGAHKIMLMGDAGKIDILQNEMKRNYMGKLNFYRTKPAYLELSASGADKVSGMKVVLKHYGYKLKDAIALGDNHNDVDMIKSAGIGVAVGNAPKEVKEVADFIAPPAIEDGVSFAIRHFFA